jgi:hypothetical protein
MAKNPWRRLVLLKQGRGIGVDDDVTHGRSGQRGVPARPQVGQERLQLRLRRKGYITLSDGIGQGERAPDPPF